MSVAKNGLKQSLLKAAEDDQVLTSVLKLYLELSEFRRVTS